jgi:hypothetical protein
MSIQSGYGFVHFPLSEEGVKSALTAISNLDGITINHITLDCSISNQLKQVLSNMEQEKSRKQVQNNYLTGMNKASPAAGSFGQPSPQSFSMQQQGGGGNNGGGIPSNFPSMMNGRHQPPQLQVQPQQQQQQQQQTTAPQIDMSAVAGLPGGSELMGKIANLIHDYTSNPRVNPAAAVVPGPQVRGNFPVPPGMTSAAGNPSHNLSGNDLYRPPAPVLDVPFNMANHGASSSSRLNEGKAFNPSTYGSGSFSEPKSYSSHETPTSSHQQNQHFFRGTSFHEELTPTERFSESRSYGSDQDKSAFSFQNATNTGNNMSFLNSNNNNSLNDPFAGEPTFGALNGSSNNNSSNSGGFDSSSYTRKQSIGHENDDDEIMKLID